MVTNMVIPGVLELVSLVRPWPYHFLVLTNLTIKSYEEFIYVPRDQKVLAHIKLLSLDCGLCFINSSGITKNGTGPTNSLQYEPLNIPLKQSVGLAVL